MGSRYQRAREMGVTDQAIKLPRPAEENDRIAQAAERFVLEPYGMDDLVDNDGPLPCDWRVFHLIKGKSVLSCGDVKWTPREDGGLMVPQNKIAKHRCTVYVLVVGDEKSFRLAGWEWGYRLALSPDVEGKSKVPSFYIPGSRLRPAASFQTVMAATFGATRRPGQ